MKLCSKFLVLFALAFISLPLSAQVTNTATLDTTGGGKIGNFSIGGYIDTYFGWTSTPSDAHDIPYFVSSARQNELNINLAFIDLRYSDSTIRGRVVPAFGTYMQSNYATEPAGLRYLYEANAGIKLSKKREIWMDAGILGSPYTNESAISKDHLMYTRSFAPEYVPYYLCGVKFSIPLSSKLNLYLYGLNGWQEIREYNTGKALGTQLEYRPNEKNLINWNTYIGDESGHGNQFLTRYFSDIYWIFAPNKKWSLTSCAYVGVQNIRLDSTTTDQLFWYNFNLQARYKINDRHAFSGRVEYFSDPDEVMSSIAGNGTGFTVYSGSLGYAFSPNAKSLLRFEGRYFQSENKRFYDGSSVNTNSMLWFCSSLTVWF
jgi:hypothetical protein